MCSCDQREAVVVIERFRNVLTKGVSCTARGYAPTASVIGVGPEEIAHGSFMRHFLYPIKGADVVQGVDTRRQPAVQTEDLVVDQSRERQVIEEIGEVLPHVRVAILSKALVVKTIDLSNLTGLVVAAKDRDALGVSDLECD
jgi:hypothetical protein